MKFKTFYKKTKKIRMNENKSELILLLSEDHDDEIGNIPHQETQTRCSFSFNQFCLTLFPIVVLVLFIVSWTMVTKPLESTICQVNMTGVHPYCFISALNVSIESEHCHCSHPSACNCWVIRDADHQITSLTLNFSEVVSPFWGIMTSLFTFFMLLLVCIFCYRMCAHK